MNKKTRHLYILIGMTFAMLLLIQIFFDEISISQFGKLVKTPNSQLNTTAKNREQYAPITALKIDKEKIRLNKGDYRYLYTTITYDEKKNLAHEPIIWKSSNEQIASVNQNGVVSGISKGSTTITATSKNGEIVASCDVTVGKTKYLAITFDDGPCQYTPKILDSFKKNYGKATFFVCGYKVVNYKKTLEDAYNLGMEIGNHTYSHKDLSSAKPKLIKKEIESNNKLIKEVTGMAPTLLRSPYGVKKKAFRKVCNMPLIFWSVDTRDWEGKSAKYLQNYLLKSAGDGEIILFHDIHEHTATAISKALPKLAKKKFEFVTVSEMYQIKGVELKKGELYYGREYQKYK